MVPLFLTFPSPSPFSHLLQTFHLPIDEAAAQLGIGVTVLKKICRFQFDVPRWPYRKLVSLDHVIETVKSDVKENPEYAEVRSFGRERWRQLHPVREEEESHLREWEKGKGRDGQGHEMTRDLWLLNGAYRDITQQTPCYTHFTTTCTEKPGCKASYSSPYYP